MNRRDLMKGSALAIGAATACVFSERAGAADARIVVEEHWAKKGNVDLYLYRKRVPGPGSQPVLVLVHGSSFSGRGGFDLQVPGHPRYSLMDEFARYGFDVWTMDHEGYGRSTRTGSNSDILSGAEDLRAALPVIEQVTGKPSVMMFGQSSGAIRAGAFTAGQPDKIERLVLDAFTHTGENAPEIMRRRARVDTYRANPSRPIDRSTFIGIFSRDDPSTFEPAVPEALAKFELAMGDRVQRDLSRYGGQLTPSGPRKNQLPGLDAAGRARRKCHGRRAAQLLRRSAKPRQAIRVHERGRARGSARNKSPSVVACHARVSHISARACPLNTRLPPLSGARWDLALLWQFSSAHRKSQRGVRGPNTRSAAAPPF